MNEDRTRKILDVVFKVAMAVDAIRSARIAAAVVYKKEIVAIGINKKKSDTFQRRFAKNPDAIFQHAETAAIKQALRYISVDELERSSLFIARAKHPSTYDRGFIQGMARPCGDLFNGCMSAINSFGIRNVIYTLEGSGYAVV